MASALLDPSWAARSKRARDPKINFFQGSVWWFGWWVFFIGVFLSRLFCFLIFFGFGFFSRALLADEVVVRFENSYLFSRQDVGAEFSLPIELSSKKALSIEFKIDSDSLVRLKRVFKDRYAVDDVEAQLEIYYFNLPTEKYFAQQIEITKDKTLIAKCTSYFTRDQGYLVPGLCSGVSLNSLYGFVIYR